MSESKKGKRVIPEKVHGEIIIPVEGKLCIGTVVPQKRLKT